MALVYRGLKHNQPEQGKASPQKGEGVQPSRGEVSDTTPARTPPTPGKSKTDENNTKE